MNALVRYPDFTSARPEIDAQQQIEFLAKQSARLKLMLTLVLTGNLMLVFGAITWLALVLHY